VFYNRYRCHTGLAALPRLNAVALFRIQLQSLTHIAGENTVTAAFRLRPPLELYFATHR
jgi:hypothetical protein